MKEAALTKIGFLASIACIVHCVAIPFVGLLLPLFGMAAHTGHEHHHHTDYFAWLEVLFWVMSAATAVWHVWNGRGLLRCYFAIVAVVGTVGLVMQLHWLLHVGFFGVAAGAVYVLRKRHMYCTHDH